MKVTANFYVPEIKGRVTIDATDTMDVKQITFLIEDRIRRAAQDFARKAVDLSGPLEFDGLLFRRSVNA